MKKRTLTIGIPAHNEEKNISHLLTSLLRQKSRNFTLEKVIVMLDGCTDNTREIVSSFETKFTRLEIRGGKRYGKSYRVNQIFSLASSDILVLLDADTVLGSTHSLEAIVSAFSHPSVGLVGGHDMPATSETLFEKMVSYSDYMWYRTRKNINNGLTIHNHHSCISALSKKLYKKITLPKNAIADDDFVYITNDKLGYSFRFAKHAILKYKTPSTLTEYLSQSVRFLRLKDEIARYFGNESASYYFVPFSHKVRGLGISFVKNPFLFISAIGLQVLSRIALSQMKEKTQDGYWHIVRSSKTLPKNEVAVHL